MNPIQKQMTKLIVSMSVSTVVGTALRVVTPVDPNLLNKVAFAIGSGAISGLVSKHAADQAVTDVEQVVTTFKTAFKPITKK